MTVKFNSGAGAHLCDRCNIMICVGFLPATAYPYIVAQGPEDHWLEPKQPEVVLITGYEDDDNIADRLKKYDKEYCQPCAVEMQIMSEVKLVSAKELYNID